MDSREHNKQYLELSEEQYVRYEALWNNDMALFPDGLKLFIEDSMKEVGYCGDSLAVAIADWVKQEDKDKSNV